MGAPSFWNIMMRGEEVESKERKYTSTISGAPALINETFVVMRAIADGISYEEIERRVLEENLFGKRTRRTSEKAWQSIYGRYFRARAQGFVISLAKTAASSLSERAKKLILFYEFCQSDDLVADLTVRCLFQQYAEGRTRINKTDILSWLNKVSEAHSEIILWTDQTKLRVSEHYLAIARDFGILEGRTTKRFPRPFVPIPTFLWVLYRLRDQSIGTKAIIHSRDFHLFLLDRQDVIALAREASRAGYIHFQAAGDIYDLTFIHQTFLEAFDGFET